MKITFALLYMLSDEDDIKVNSDDGIDIQLSQMIEKKEGVWECKVCGRPSTRLSDIKRHAEIHIGGMYHKCHICSKTYNNRTALKGHISHIHSVLLSCNICGKVSRSRSGLRLHNRQEHRNSTLF